jgi:hypothetical protein
MSKAIIVDKIKSIADKRKALVELLDKPDIGSLRLDVNQALEELDELIEELNKTFPEESTQN